MPFQTASFLTTELDLVQGQMKQGETIIQANFDAIRIWASRFTKSPLESEPRKGVDVITEIQQTSVPSTQVRQHRGLDLTKFKGAKKAEEKEESSSMVLIFIGVCAALGFIAFS